MNTSQTPPPRQKTHHTKNPYWLVASGIWFSIGSLVTGTGCRPVAPQHVSPNRPIDAPMSCAKLHTSQINGWIDQWDGECALLWDDSNHRTIKVHRSSLPPHVKEGDHLSQGMVRPLQRQRLQQELHKLLSQRQPPPEDTSETNPDHCRVSRKPKSRKSAISPKPGKTLKTSRKSQRLDQVPKNKRHRWRRHTWRHRWNRWSLQPRCWRHWNNRWSKKRRRIRWRRIRVP